jgi:hypothetical protein
MPLVFSLLNTKCKYLANNYNFFLLNSKMIKNVYLGWPDLVTAEYLHNQAWQNAWQSGEANTWHLITFYLPCVLLYTN